MGHTICDIIESSGGSRCIVRREGWDRHDYAVVHRISGHGTESEAFGFTYHHKGKLEAGSIRRAWTESWHLVRKLPGQVDRGRYRDKTSRMLRAAAVIGENGITSWRGFLSYLDGHREDDTGMLELYGCMKDRDQRRALARCMEAVRCDMTASA